MNNDSQLNLQGLNKIIFNKKFFWFFLTIFSLEILSFFVFLFPSLANTVFVIILLAALLLSLKDLKYGLLILFVELFISSKGYLFYWQEGKTVISVRIALWLIIMSVWLAKYLIEFFRDRKVQANIFVNLRFFKIGDLPLFLVLFLLILGGLANGLISQNDFSNVFFDFNSWLFILLVLPVYFVASKSKSFKFDILQILILGSCWVSLKTLWAEFFFSHPGFMTSGVVYKWIRTSGVGEITLMDSGFVRVFLQSQIFVLIAFFLVLFIFNHFVFSKNIQSKRDALPWFACLSIFVAVIIVSLSRSFWLGAMLTFFFYLVIAGRKYVWRNLLKTITALFAATILALLLIVVLIKFPYPETADIDLGLTLESRVNSLNESAVSSRYALWPKLTSRISDNPLLGSGFGSTVTYQSSDPRVREQTSDGTYTTYAFEWGWLDIWLKMGLLGMIFFLYLFTLIIKRNLLKNNWFNFTFALGLLLLIVVSFFSPYTNHPLGLGFLIIASVFSYKEFD